MIANALLAFRERATCGCRDGKYVADRRRSTTAEAVAAIEGRIAGFCSGYGGG